MPASRPKRSSARANTAKASAASGRSTHGVVVEKLVAKVRMTTKAVPAIQSLRNTRRSRKSMKKKSTAVKMASRTAAMTPASSARTPNSAFSGGNNG